MVQLMRGSLGHAGHVGCKGRGSACACKPSAAHSQHRLLLLRPRLQPPALAPTSAPGSVAPCAYCLSCRQPHTAALHCHRAPATAPPPTHDTPASALMMLQTCCTAICIMMLVKLNRCKPVQRICRCAATSEAAARCRCPRTGLQMSAARSRRCHNFNICACLCHNRPQWAISHPFTRRLSYSHAYGKYRTTT